MYDALVRLIRTTSTTPLSDSDIDLLKSILVPKKLRKRQYLLQEGEVCKYTAFVVKGALCQYGVDKKGAIHVLQLYLENWWASDRESFATGAPSAYYIDAWEETDVLLFSREGWDAFRTIPAVSEIKDKVEERHAVALLKRVHDAISLPAEERYAELSKRYPEFLQRFPQHIIASYLGITKETLSRIRHQAVKKH